VSNEDKYGFVVWFTGLPGAGKATTARILEDEFHKKGLKVQGLDRDEVRKNLSPELGFSKENRELHAKRATYMSSMLDRNGVITIVAR
jgi:adenylylsulfate kinase